MLRYFFLAILIIILYRFVVFIVLPFLNLTRTATNKIKAMQQQMEAMNQQQQQAQQRKAAPKHVDGDYIDYEEVK